MYYAFRSWVLMSEYLMNIFDINMTLIVGLCWIVIENLLLPLESKGERHFAWFEVLPTNFLF